MIQFCFFFCTVDRKKIKYIVLPNMQRLILEAKVQWTRAVLKERIFFWILIAFRSTMLEVDEEVMQKNICCESVNFP
jgi:hypothetical protein